MYQPLCPWTCCRYYLRRDHQNAEHPQHRERWGYLAPSLQMFVMLCLFLRTVKRTQQLLETWWLMVDGWAPGDFSPGVFFFPWGTIGSFLSLRLSELFSKAFYPVQLKVTHSLVLLFLPGPRIHAWMPVADALRPLHKRVVLGLFGKWVTPGS